VTTSVFSTYLVGGLLPSTCIWTNATFSSFVPTCFSFTWRVLLIHCRSSWAGRRDGFYTCLFVLDDRTFSMDLPPPPPPPHPSGFCSLAPCLCCLQTCTAWNLFLGCLLTLGPAPAPCFSFSACTSPLHWTYCLEWTGFVCCYRI